MSDEQQPIPGADGAGRRVRPRADDTPQLIAGLRASLNVISRDLLDLDQVARQAKDRSEAAATTAGGARDDAAKLAEALTGHLDGYAAWRTEVEEAIAALTGGKEKKPKGQPSWLTIDGNDDEQLDRAVKLLAELAEWIEQVWCQYPGGRLPHCWAYHPWAVSELLAVWQAWRNAYIGKSSCPVKVMDWLDRWRPATASRLSNGLGGCSLRSHLPDGDQSFIAGRLPGGTGHLEDVAVWWAATRGERVCPTPTAAAIQIERAETI